jgi:hypothetical protein
MSRGFVKRNGLNSALFGRHGHPCLWEGKVWKDKGGDNSPNQLWLVGHWVV